jgi:hypothetical protein
MIIGVSGATDLDRARGLGVTPLRSAVVEALRGRAATT